MNREDVMLMAKEAGFNWPRAWGLSQLNADELERFATLAAEWGAKQEREVAR